MAVQVIKYYPRICSLLSSEKDRKIETDKATPREARSLPAKANAIVYNHYKNTKAVVPGNAGFAPFLVADCRKYGIRPRFKSIRRFLEDSSFKGS